MQELFSARSESAFFIRFIQELEQCLPIGYADMWVREIPSGVFRSITHAQLRSSVTDGAQSDLLEKIIVWHDSEGIYAQPEQEKPHQSSILALGNSVGHLFAWFEIEFCDLSFAQENSAYIQEVLQIAGFAFERMQLANALRQLSNHTLDENLNGRVDVLSLISQYISHLSHQLKNPMTSIRGYSDLITSGFLGQVSDQQAQSLETVIYNLDRVNEGVLVPNTFFKLYANRLRLEKRVEDIGDILCRICDQFARMKNRTGVCMICDAPDDFFFPTDRYFFEEALRGTIKTCLQFMDADQDCMLKSFICVDDLFLVLNGQVSLPGNPTRLDDFNQAISDSLQDGHYHELYALWKKTEMLWRFIGGEIVNAELQEKRLRLTLRLQP